MVIPALSPNRWSPSRALGFRHESRRTGLLEQLVYQGGFTMVYVPMMAILRNFSITTLPQALEIRVIVHGLIALQNRITNILRNKYCRVPL